MKWYKRLPNSIKASINSAWQAFLGTFGVYLAGWLTDVAKWTTSDAHFPSVSPLGKAFVAGLVAAATFLVTVIYRGVQEVHNPAAVPQYPPTSPAVDAVPLDDK